jgi:HK97 gp10 family phage protein
MADQSGVKVVGLREISRALRNVGVPASEVKAAGIQSAQSVINEAKALVPVRSGKLRDSIRLSSTAGGKITIMAGNNRSGKSGVPYANPIHWGWFKRKIAPQPFFSKALGYTREEIYNTYFAQLERLITEQYAKSKIK